MRRSLFVIVLLAIFAAPGWAQTPPPVPDVQPPAMAPLDDSLEPQVTIKKQEGDTIEEHRLNGRLYKIKVTPKYGAPYTLVDLKGDGSFSPVDAPGTPALSVPMWVIGTF